MFNLAIDFNIKIIYGVLKLKWLRVFLN